jgi:outer membrane immunogenic protein
MRRLAGWAICCAVFGWLVAGSVAIAQPQNGARQQNDNSSYNWNGFYGGGNLGGAFGGSDFLSALNSGVPFFEGEVYPGFPNSATPGIIAAYRSNHVNVRSLTGGLQAGYNVWAGGFLLGIEADISLLRAKKSRTTSALGLVDAGQQATYTFTNEIDANYIASLRPRIGKLVGDTLLYATGGVAVTTLKYQHHFRGTGGFFAGGPDITENASASETKVGWTLGGGVERPIASNITFKTEYLFTAFGNVSTEGNKINPLSGAANPPDFACGVDTHQGGIGGTFAFLTGPTPRQCFNHKADLFLHSIKLGLNFKF